MIGSLPNNKAPGEDGIGAEFIKGLPDIMKEEIYKSLNKM